MKTYSLLTACDDSGADVVVSQDRPDLEKAVEEAFRERWPEFIFHGPVSKAHVPRVRWDGTAEDLPSGYDDGLVRAVESEHVIASIRPAWKSRYPNVPMSEYASWTREDGLSIDPGSARTSEWAGRFWLRHGSLP